MCLENIHCLFKIYQQLSRFQRIRICGFTTRQNYNSRRLKKLQQYIDLQLDLQELQLGRCFFQSFKCVFRTVAIFYWSVLNLLVHFSSCFIHLDKWQRHEPCLDYTYILVAEERMNVCETIGR